MSIAHLLEIVQNLSSRDQGFAAHHHRLQAQHDGNDERQHAVAVVAHFGGISGKHLVRFLGLDFLFLLVLCGEARFELRSESTQSYNQHPVVLNNLTSLFSFGFRIFLSNGNFSNQFLCVFCRALVIVLDSKIQSIRLVT